MPRRLTRWLTVFIGAGCILAAMAAQAGEGSESASVVVGRCRITFVDQVTLASLRDGIMDYIGPKEGDRVDAGEPVAKLLDLKVRAEHAVAESRAASDVDVRFMQKSAEFTKLEYDKAVDANRRAPGAFPEIDLLRLKLAYEKATLQTEKAQSDLQINRLVRDAAEAELRMHRLEAPFRGIVTRVFKSRGESVRTGEPVLQIVNLDRVRVEGYISVKDGWKVRPGDRVTVQVEIPEADLEIEQRSFPGAISFVDVAVEPVSGQVRIFAEVDNPEHLLRAGLSARMTIHPGSAKTVRSAESAGNGK